MILYLYISLIALFVVVLVKLLAHFMSEKVLICREEFSSYECGFEHHGLSRVPFSLRYFFLTLIFLLFDLEIVLILFLPSSVLSYSSYFSLALLLGFILFLYFSLVYE